MKKTSLAFLAGAVIVAGYGVWHVTHQAGAPAAAKSGAQGPTTVTVITPRRQDVPVIFQANGTVTPISTVDLHPQITSTIARVHIKEGQFVRAGELMFTLDDRSARANLDKAQAQVARDQASLADLQRQYQRSQELLSKNFIAQGAVDTLKSQVEAARALVQADTAAARSAGVDASYSAIRAPMAGRVGAINVYPGSLVQLSTSLTTITQLDPITVAFTLPESALADVLAAQRAGSVPVQVTAGAGGASSVSGGASSVSDGASSVSGGATSPASGAASPSGTTLDGVLSFVDNTVDPVAGVIRVKAQFANAGTPLWPGQYVNARLTVRTLKDALVVPQNAIISNTRGTFVYTVAPDQTAKTNPVQRLYAFGTDAAVSGLTADAQVIVEGKQNLRPGGKVKPVAAGGHDSASAQATPLAQKGKTE
ncbi:efflux RND transporter periplasmic adaptor subunit [Rugamonas apoptosis]|uniref:Efflux RND transporter periplasmic adaptor subunit n=1 Tax=Rugamonas apoptosis TaxID=2758570 RepID=A0A7W2F5N2_9BURK|nr:efflux RND transporter periplasmic adaptor subunit [Rugamonas apoptosis]MBA5685572.1 efflux RND transporter periplasmic adaptor subunit [Rugamonas apoptosis]